MDTPPTRPSESRDLPAWLQSPAVHRVRDRTGALRHVSHLETVNVAGGGADPHALADQYVRDYVATFTREAPPALALTLPVPAYYQPAEDSRNRVLYAGEQKNGPGTTVVSYIQTLRGLPIWEAGLAVTVNQYGSAGWRVTDVQNSLDTWYGAEFSDPGPPAQWRIQLDQSPPPSETRAPAGPPITTLTPTVLRTLLNPDLSKPFPDILKITPGGRLLVYHYSEAAHKRRVVPYESQQLTFDNWFAYPADPRSPQPAPFTLPPVLLPLSALSDTIRANTLYVVQEIFFTLAHAPRKRAALPVPWRAFLEVQSGAVLYTEPGIAACFEEIFDLTVRTTPAAAGDAGSGFVDGTGNVFLVDPVSPNPGSGDSFAVGAAPDPDRFATAVQLQGLWDERSALHHAGDPIFQQLKGEWVEIGEVYDPNDTFPELAAPDVSTSPDPNYDFGFDIATNSPGFTAVNAYYHCDAVFRMLDKLHLLSQFPLQHIRVDPDGMDTHLGALVLSNELFSAVGQMCFGPVRDDASPSAQQIGCAMDPRVVLHEFCHALLLASVQSLNLGFAHSVGDTLAAILTDPCCAQDGEDRFRTFPWLMAENPDLDAEWRFHGGELREATAGWYWGGPCDVEDETGYAQEQILSATLFNIYWVIGNDADPLTMAAPASDPVTIVAPARVAAARYMAYLIIRAISKLPQRLATPTATPAAFATALIDADTATDATMNPVPDGSIPGGSIRKVIQWGFAQRGAPVGADAFSPVIIPAVDVYIGPPGPTTYPLPEVRGEIWNRQAAYPADQPIPCGDVSQPLQLEGNNYIYVCARNNGTATATNVRLLGYARRLTLGQHLPDLQWDRPAWIELTAPAALPDIAAGGSQVLGPFEWTPPDEGPWVILVAVSADGDLANIASTLHFACSDGPVTLARLLPFDNNIAACQL